MLPALRRARSRDPEDGAAGKPSFDEVFDRGLPYVWHVLRRLGVPRADQDDRVQDVFFAGYQSLPTYDPTRALQPWLHGIAFHVVRKHYARTRREVLVEEVAEPIDEALDPEQATAESRERELLLRLMGRLDLDHRAVVSMHIDGIDMPDIARELGIAVATAYKRLDRARRSLQAAAAREPRERRAGGAAAFVPLDLAALFAADRSIPDVPAPVRSRARSRLRAAPAAARAVAHAAARVAPYVLGAVAGAAGMYAYLRPVRPSPPPAPMEQTVSALAREMPVAPATAPAPRAAGPPEAVASARAPASAMVADPDETEEALIQRARIAYARGNTSSAMDALRLHARRYPRGELAADRQALRVQVALRQNRSGLVDFGRETPR